MKFIFDKRKSSGSKLERMIIAEAHGRVIALNNGQDAITGGTTTLEDIKRGLEVTQRELKEKNPGQHKYAHDVYLNIYQADGNRRVLQIGDRNETASAYITEIND